MMANFKNKKILIFDTETDSKDPQVAKLKWFGAYSYLHDAYYMLQFPRDKNEIVSLLKEHKIHVGFNNKDYDNILIEKNLNLNEDIFEYKVIVDLLEMSGPKIGNGVAMNRKNRLVQMGYKLKNFTLKNIISELKLDKEIGNKGDIDYALFQKDIWTNEEAAEIVKYLKQDVDLTKLLFEWYEDQFFPLKRFLPKKEQDNLLYLKSSLSVLAYNIICNKAGLKPEFGQKSNNNQSYEGGHHIESRQSLVKGNIIEVDFTSAYPHAIMQANLHSTVGEDEDGWTGDGYYTVEGKYNNKSRGKIELALQDIFLERLKAKKEGDKPKDKSYKIVINCFSEDTEVMTVDGIKKLKDCKVGDMVYSINTSTEKVELKPIEKMYEQKYLGDMIHFKDKNKDLIVTPEHKMLFKGKGSMNYVQRIEAKNLINRSGKYPETKPIPGLKDKYIDMKKFQNERYHKQHDEMNIPDKIKSKDLFYFIGIVLSEGILRNKKNKGGNYLRISQYKNINPNSYNKIKKCLDDINIRYTHTNKIFNIHSRHWINFVNNFFIDSFNCHIPEWCWKYDSSLLECLHEGLYDGDGDKKRYRYTTVSKILKNDMIRLNLHLGHRVTVSEELYVTKVNKLSRKIWRVFRTGDGWYERRDENHNEKYIKNLTNKVICCSVKDNHTIFAGRNNKFIWTGQSHYGTTGNPVFKSMYNRNTASDCTSIVRTWMKKLAQSLTEGGYECLYGFTDSIFVLVPEGLTKNELMTDVNNFLIEATSHLPFPMDTFKMEVEEEIKMIWFIAKNCYLFVTKANEIKYKSTLLNTNTPKAVMKLFENYMKPIMIEKLEIPFTKKDLEEHLKLILEADTELGAQEYKVNDLSDYKVETSLQYQISKRYGAGRHFLIPNRKGIGIGKEKDSKKRRGLRYCNLKEFKEANLKTSDIELSHLLLHLKAFYEYNKPKEKSFNQMSLDGK